MVATKSSEYVPDICSHEYKWMLICVLQMENIRYILSQINTAPVQELSMQCNENPSSICNMIFNIILYIYNQP